MNNMEVWIIFHPREEAPSNEVREDYEVFSDELSGRRFILAKWNDRARRLELDEPIKSLQDLESHFYRDRTCVLFHREDSDQYFRMEKKIVKH